MLSDLCPPQSTVFIWGWSPEIYSYYDYVPVSRYIIAYSIIQKSHGTRPVRLYDELLASSPDCILDTSSSEFFGAFLPGQTLAQTVPRMSGFLTKNYQATVAEVLVDNRKTLLNVYLRKEL